jgi:pyridoxal phosphate enzyme (YggS family)
MPETVCQRKTSNNIAKVRARIQQAALKNDRDVNSIRLLAVSKTRSSHELREAFDAGISDFGENYVQEAEVKIKALDDLPIVWHFIGPVQSNKTALIAEHFTWLHSLDRLKIAERLSRQRPESLAPLNVCVQINIDDEVSKSGIRSHELAAFADELIKLPGLSLRGLMAIPDPTLGKDQLKYSFRAMRVLFEMLQLQFPKQQFPQLDIDTLSMGMSADLELAIAEGSTLVRIGTDIFGSRNKQNQD